MIQKSDKILIAVLASGNGSNAEAIMKYFENHPRIQIRMILSNNQDAYVLKRGEKYGIPTMVFGKNDLYESDKLISVLKELKIDWIVLAGFLWLIPEFLLKAFPNHIVNIHPALLPKYGGKGMYGMKVHEAVIASKENQSGITIHLLNEKYDEGKIIFQATTEITSSETPQSLAEKIQQLEHEYYPGIIEKIISDSANVTNNDTQ